MILHAHMREKMKKVFIFGTSKKFFDLVFMVRELLSRFPS